MFNFLANIFNYQQKFLTNWNSGVILSNFFLNFQSYIVSLGVCNTSKKCMSQEMAKLNSQTQKTYVLTKKKV